MHILLALNATLSSHNGIQNDKAYDDTVDTPRSLHQLMILGTEQYLHD